MVLQLLVTSIFSRGMMVAYNEETKSSERKWASRGEREIAHLSQPAIVSTDHCEQREYAR